MKKWGYKAFYPRTSEELDLPKSFVESSYYRTNDRLFFLNESDRISIYTEPPHSQYDDRCIFLIEFDGENWVSNSRAENKINRNLNYFGDNKYRRYLPKYSSYELIKMALNELIERVKSEKDKLDNGVYRIPKFSEEELEKLELGDLEDWLGLEQREEVLEKWAKREEQDWNEYYLKLEEELEIDEKSEVNENRQVETIKTTNQPAINTNKEIDKEIADNILRYLRIHKESKIAINNSHLISWETRSKCIEVRRINETTKQPLLIITNKNNEWSSNANDEVKEEVLEAILKANQKVDKYLSESRQNKNTKYRGR